MVTAVQLKKESASEPTKRLRRDKPSRSRKNVTDIVAATREGRLQQ